MEAYLLEANVMGIFPETLTTNIQAVFTDEAMSVGASSTKREKKKEINKINQYSKILRQFVKTHRNRRIKRMEKDFRIEIEE